MALTAVVSLCHGQTMARAETTVASLRCEQLADPEGIDVVHPRLSWIIRSDEAGQRQTAYQVMAARSPEALHRDSGDLWDSGRVESGQSVGVVYRGPPLESHGECFWKVRVWGLDGRASAWSEPARWSTGLLSPDDWRATWIGWEEELPRRVVEDTAWIWYPEESAVEASPVGKRWFRRAFEIPEDRPFTNVVLRITADDTCAIFMDGREIGTRAGPQATKEMDLTSRMEAGRHVLAVLAENTGPAPNPAGLIMRLQVDFEAGEPLVVRGDGDWKAAREEEAGWQRPEFDDGRWPRARVLGPVGMPPWGAVRRAEERRLPARHLRTEFTVESPVRRAIVSLCGQGLSELYLNGDKVGDRVLSPALSEYPRRLLYVTHDVTKHLRGGRNAIGVILGNGRYFAPRSQVYANMPTAGLPKLLLQMRIEHQDGSVSTVVSDGRWRLTRDGPIVANNEYDGEEYDARRELGAWSEPGYDDASWPAAQQVEAPSAALSAEMIEPIRVVERLPARAVHQTPSGSHVFDLGQNIVGWCRLNVAGPAGTRVTLRHAERLKPDGSLDRANLRGARATDVYTLAGSADEAWEPRFTSHGFRYVEVAGFPGTPRVECLEGCVVHDDLDPVGTIVTSNEVLNRIYRNAIWGLRGNYRSVPTDCPQRDERQAWLGDRLQVARGEAYVFDTAAFYAKWLQDIHDAQRIDGVIPDVAPAHWPSFTDNVTWPSAAILVAEGHYRHFGDREIIARHYPCCARWIEHMRSFVKDGIIDRDTYGDWCVPPEDPALIHSQDPQRRTNPTLLATAFFCRDLAVMAEFATLLGKPDDAARFGREAAAMREAFHHRFFRPEEGFYDNGTQTSCVMPLAFDLVPEPERPRVVRRLVRQIEEQSHGHIGTGLVGGQFLHRVLSDAGHGDLALAIAAQRSYPSLGFMAEQGATTVWELWNGNTADPAMNSGNHVMLVGDLIEWMYGHLAGIAPAEGGAGFQAIRLEPRFVKGLDFVKATYRSPYGTIESHWQRTDSGIRWEVVVPANATAVAVLPVEVLDGLRVNGSPVAAATDIESVEVPADARSSTMRPAFRLQSGRHVFGCDDPRSL